MLVLVFLVQIWVFLHHMRYWLFKQHVVVTRNKGKSKVSPLCLCVGTMKLRILLTVILQVAVIESLREVSGYLGDTVTLSSGADPSWTLSSIEWSIFPNNTWIATYRNGNKNIERVDRYKGRLSLNTSSGDLMIHNLNKEDAMEYTVDLINTQRQNKGTKTKLIVIQRLVKPIIETVTCASVKGGSWLWLRCSSKDTGVNLSWQHTFPSVTLFNMTSPDGNSADLLGFLNTTQNRVSFTCTSSRNMEDESSVVTPKCGDDKPLSPSLSPSPSPSLPPPRERNFLVFFAGFLVGALLVVIIFFFKGKRKTSSS
uniref:Immunoglobulin domain-containing protein n=1 Tax=Sander lucioperca TaxID=283035 RepID=A0A8C9X7V7_SANLU